MTQNFFFLVRDKTPVISQKTYFFADLHADRRALLNSLEYCDDTSALYFIGGDCLDKGPSNLNLLRELKKLSEKVQVRFIAGNHDLRMLMVLQNWDDQDNFLFQRIFSPERFEKRIVPFLEECGGIEAAKEMFLDPEGEFGWFFPSLNLLHQDNNFLFTHAGVSDVFAYQLKDKGQARFNAQFRKLTADKDTLFDFYYSQGSGAFRTKYRTKDAPFTPQGAKALREAGVNFVAHGHDSQTQGHRLRYIEDIPHLACDVTVNSGSRWKENLGTQSGWGVAVFDPGNNHIRCFSPEARTGLDWRLYT